MGKIGGIINKMIMGSEKSEDYARSKLPSNRWELFWDVLKGSFSKIILTNLLVLLFFLPLILLIIFRSSAIMSYGSIYPFSQGFGVGYLSTPSFIGYSQTIVVNVNMTILLFLPVALAIASLGIAGGAYVIRNMIWTEGIFVANDFWRGIKNNIKQVMLTCVIYSVILYGLILSFSLTDQLMALGSAPNWLLVICKIAMIVLFVLVSIMFFHMISLSVTYELKYGQLIKNAFLLTFGLIVQNLFFFLLAVFPFMLLLFNVSILLIIGLVFVALIGFAYFLLVWTDYSQWIYDKFINDKVPGAQKNRGIYEKYKSNKGGSAALKQYAEQVSSFGHSTLSNRPIKPITDDEFQVAELPTSFNRDDIAKLSASKQAIYDEDERYYEEHKNDPEFQLSEEEIAKKANDEERQKRIEKAQRELNKRRKK